MLTGSSGQTGAATGRAYRPKPRWAGLSDRRSGYYESQATTTPVSAPPVPAQVAPPGPAPLAENLGVGVAKTVAGHVAKRAAEDYIASTFSVEIPPLAIAAAAAGTYAISRDDDIRDWTNEQLGADENGWGHIAGRAIEGTNLGVGLGAFGGPLGAAVGGALGSAVGTTIGTAEVGWEWAGDQTGWWGDGGTNYETITSGHGGNYNPEAGFSLPHIQGLSDRQVQKHMNRELGQTRNWSNAYLKDILQVAPKLNEPVTNAFKDKSYEFGGSSNKWIFSSGTDRWKQVHNIENRTRNIMRNYVLGNMNNVGKVSDLGLKIDASNQEAYNNIKDYSLGGDGNINKAKQIRAFLDSYIAKANSQEPGANRKASGVVNLQDIIPPQAWTKNLHASASARNTAEELSVQKAAVLSAQKAAA